MHEFFPTLALALGAIAYEPAPARAAAQAHSTAWAAPMYEPGPFAADQPMFSRLSSGRIQVTVRPTLSGSRTRFRFSNARGASPLRISEVRAGDGQVLFGGRAAAVVPPGGVLTSDWSAAAITGGEPLSISFEIAGGDRPSAHYIGGRTTLVTPATDHANPTAHSINAWLYLDRIEVTAEAPVIVAMGDSITAGVANTLDQDRRWPDALDRALDAQGADWGVVSAGINGGNLARPSACFGAAMVDRLKPDAIDLAGARAVIILGGVNDLIQPAIADRLGCLPRGEVGHRELIAAFERGIALSRAAGVEPYVGTITPFGGFEIWSERMEGARQAVNAWIRSQSDAQVVDFDRLLADPAKPDRLASAYDSGDGLHPNDAGAEAMGRLAAERLLQGQAGRGGRKRPETSS